MTDETSKSRLEPSTEEWATDFLNEAHDGLNKAATAQLLTVDANKARLLIGHALTTVQNLPESDRTPWPESVVEQVTEAYNLLHDNICTFEQSEALEQPFLFCRSAVQMLRDNSFIKNDFNYCAHDQEANLRFFIKDRRKSWQSRPLADPISLLIENGEASAHKSSDNNLSQDDAAARSAQSGQQTDREAPIYSTIIVDDTKLNITKGDPAKDLGLSGTVNQHDGYHFHAKVYDVGSTFGINNGPVSKLHVYHHNQEVFSYSRCWETRPATPEDHAVLEAILDGFIVPEQNLAIQKANPQKLLDPDIINHATAIRSEIDTNSSYRSALRQAATNLANDHTLPYQFARTLVADAFREETGQTFSAYLKSHLDHLHEHGLDLPDRLKSRIDNATRDLSSKKERSTNNSRRRD